MSVQNMPLTLSSKSKPPHFGSQPAVSDRKLNAGNRLQNFLTRAVVPARGWPGIWLSGLEFRGFLPIQFTFSSHKKQGFKPIHSNRQCGITQENPHSKHNNCQNNNEPSKVGSCATVLRMANTGQHSYSCHVTWYKGWPLPHRI